MGQYYLTVNLDKREYLYPHKFGDGLKLLEFGDSSSGTMTGLAVLLADGNGRGGGDLNSENPIVGSWAGDQIVVTGDYADGGKFLDGLELTTEQLQAIADKKYTEGYNKPERVNLYGVAQAHFTDISERVIEAMCDDSWLRRAIQGEGPLTPMRPDVVMVSTKED